MHCERPPCSGGQAGWKGRFRFSARAGLGFATAARGRTLSRLAGQGTTGSIRAEGWVLSWKMVFVAVTHLAEFDAGSPVFRLRSKRGKLLLETSRRMMWPFRKTLLVAHRSTEILYTWSGFISSGFSCESR